MFNTEPMEFIGVDENGFATYRETTKEPENMANTENDVIHREIVKRATEMFDPQATTWRECWNAAIEKLNRIFIYREQPSSAAHVLKFVDKEPKHPYEELNWVEVKPLKQFTVDDLEYDQVQIGKGYQYEPAGDDRKPKAGANVHGTEGAKIVENDKPREYVEVRFGSLEKYSGDQPKIGDTATINSKKHTLTENQETKQYEWVPVPDDRKRPNH